MAMFGLSRTTLRSRLQSRELTQDEALAIAAEVGGALAQTHAAGRIHGYLSVASVVLRESRATIEGSSSESPTAEDIGDLAPERIAGGAPTVAADIYSF